MPYGIKEPLGPCAQVHLEPDGVRSFVHGWSRHLLSPCRPARLLIGFDSKPPNGLRRLPALPPGRVPPFRPRNPHELHPEHR